MKARAEIMAAARKAGERLGLNMPKRPTLLTAPLSQVKMAKGVKLGVLSWILNLAPATESGVINTCPWAGKCADSCIRGAGQNHMKPAANARLWKTTLYHREPELFRKLLDSEIEAAIASAERKGMVPSFRLNGLSDLDWSDYPQWFPEAKFYDYTKGIARAIRFRKAVPQYHVVYSYSERTPNEWPKVKEFMDAGGTMAVVFSTKKGQALPDTFMGYQVIDGDETDVRFMDPPGAIVGLRWKAAADSERKCTEAIDAGFCVKVSEGSAI